MSDKTIIAELVTNKYLSKIFSDMTLKIYN